MGMKPVFPASIVPQRIADGPSWIPKLISVNIAELHRQIHWSVIRSVCPLNGYIARKQF
jgi:hypothetical protein